MSKKLSLKNLSIKIKIYSGLIFIFITISAAVFFVFLHFSHVVDVDIPKEEAFLEMEINTTESLLGIYRKELILDKIYSDNWEKDVPE